jgi:hypothetical protein
MEVCYVKAVEDKTDKTIEASRNFNENIKLSEKYMLYMQLLGTH